jgi:hypothetical protein
MICMLNLVFNPSADNVNENNDARFMENPTTPTPLLQQSKVWLQPASATITNPRPAYNADWTFYRPDTGNLQLQKGDQVWIRVCLNSPVTGYVARLTVVVARNSGRASLNSTTEKPYQTRASPFQPPNSAQDNPQSCVLYDFELPTYQNPTTPPPQDTTLAPYWIQELGAVFFTQSPVGEHDAYSVIVAITAGKGTEGDADPTNLVKYSHDPDMEVNC